MKQLGTTNKMLDKIIYKILHQIARMTYKIPRISFEARLIEYGFVITNIDNGQGKKRVLDIGCCESNLPTYLAEQGYDTYGIDIGVYTNPKSFTFVQGDLRKMHFHDEFFDVVIAVSTIEHVGLGRYNDPLSSEGDKEALREIKRVLKQGGQLLVTIPCGKDTVCYSKERVPLSRVYSSNSLVGLLSGFKVLELSYIVKKGHIWLPASKSKAEQAVKDASPEKTGMTAIALINAYKEKT